MIEDIEEIKDISASTHAIANDDDETPIAESILADIRTEKPIEQYERSLLLHRPAIQRVAHNYPIDWMRMHLLREFSPGSSLLYAGL